MVFFRNFEEIFEIQKQFLPARAEKFLFLPRFARQSKFAVRIFVKKSADFNQKTPPIGKSEVSSSENPPASALYGVYPHQ